MLFSIAAESATPPENSSGGFTMGKGLVVIWLLLWSLITLAVDLAVLLIVAQTMLAWNYAVVTGTISQSEVRRNAGEKGDKIAADVKYLFRVDDRDFTGSIVSLFDVVRIRPLATEQLVKSLPVGKSVEVFYNPSDPSVCILNRSLDGRPLFLGLLLLPPNLVMFAGWRFALRVQRGIRNSLIQPDGNRWIVRRWHGSPLAVALIVAGAIDLVAIILLSPSDLSANTIVLSFVWLALIGMTTLAYWHTLSAIRKDLPILIADNVSRTLIWPSTTADCSDQTISVAQLRSVEFGEASTPMPNGRNGLSYSVSLSHITEEGQVITRLVLKTTNANEAETLADFLDDWTGLRHRRQESASVEEI